MEMTLLRKLAHLYRIETSYRDLKGQHQSATKDALLTVLRALGAPLATLEDVPAAIREHQQALWRQPIEPVAVAWDGGALTIELRLPARLAEATLPGRLKLEN